MDHPVLRARHKMYQCWRITRVRVRPSTAVYKCVRRVAEIRLFPTAIRSDRSLVLREDEEETGNDDEAPRRRRCGEFNSCSYELVILEDGQFWKWTLN